MNEVTDLKTGEEGANGQGVLDPVEIRVLAVLAEKEALTPDNYPLSLNALTNGCNQLSSREPVMTLSEDAVMDVLQRLLQKKLVSEVRQVGARVSKYEHRMRIKWVLEQDKMAVLTTLMLRGVQTAGEVRLRSARIFDFASVAEVETALQFLIDKYPPLVARLARSPGMKEVRYGHLLSGGEIDAEVSAVTVTDRKDQEQNDDRLARLETELAVLRSEFERLSAQFDSFRKQFD